MRYINYSQIFMSIDYCEVFKHLKLDDRLIESD
jgi:hypothetical protein